MTNRLVALDATPLLGRRTGIGVYCAGLLGALANRPGLSVRAYAVSWRRRAGIVEHLPAGVDRASTPMPARPLHASWRRLAVPPAEWFVGPVDVVHGTNYVVPPTRRAAAVVSVYDLTTVRYPQLCDPATLAFPAMVRRAVARGAWVHTLSHFVAREVVDVLGVDPERVRAVWSGIPALPTVDAQLAGRARARLGGTGGPYVLAVGTVEPRKDLPGLVAAFDRLATEMPDLSLVLAGGDGWGTAELDRAVSRISSAAVRGRVVRTGWVDDGELAGLVAGADVLAYPSRYEGFGFPPLQAMAVGTPVVATAVGSLPEMLGDAALLVPPGEPDALADALAQALGSPDVADRLRRDGIRRAAALTWERCADGMVELYDAAACAR